MADIHHIGIRIGNLDETLRVFGEAFHVTVQHDTTRPGGIRIAYAHFGNCRLELIEDPAVGSGAPTIDHFAVQSDDIRADMAELADAGYGSTDQEPRVSAFGNQVAAFDPATFAGIKLHLVSEPQ